MLRVGLVGTGGIAQAHLLHWLARPAVKVVALCDVRPEAAAQTAQHFSLDPSCLCPDLTALLRRDLDVVDLCTPPWLHQEQTTQVLATGRHVILEKPLAPSLNSFDTLVALDQAGPGRVVPVLQNRLGLGPRQLRAIQAAGLTGRFLHGSLTTGWRREAAYYAVPWRGRHATEVGGCLTGLAIHQLDLVMEFLPAPTAVMAHTATQVHAIEVEDSGAALFTFADGAWLSLTASVHHHHERSDGRLVFANLEVSFGPAPYHYAAESWVFRAHDPLVQRQIDSVLASVPARPAASGYHDLWVEAARVWHERCQGGSDLDPDTGARLDLASARPGLMALTGLYAAAKRGRLVTLPLVDNDPYVQRMAP